MQPEIWKFVTFAKDVLMEGFRKTSASWRDFAVPAALANPWAGRLVADLKSEIQASGPILGEVPADRMIVLAGGGYAMETHGKAAVVELDGEIEHASDLIHALQFCNFFRQAVGAKSCQSFTSTHGPTNAPIMIPLMDKNDARRRSHNLTGQLSIPDAHRANDAVVAPGAAMSGRPNHRMGDRYQDLKDLGHDVDNPAAV